MKKTNALLIIDAQYDFCDPSGVLYVKGADADMVRLGTFIEKNSNNIDFICLSKDIHEVNDISHPKYWRDKDGNNPKPFTVITKDDVLCGKWIPLNNITHALAYIGYIETKNKQKHIIWPEHCIKGTKGSDFDDTLMLSINTWLKTPNNKKFNISVKGENCLTEHFGIFEANMPLDDFKETQFNMELINSLSEYDNIYLAGEAKDFCVASSLEQMLRFPELSSKIIILEDCMSNVFENPDDSIYSCANECGVRFASSTTEIQC